MFKTKLGVSCDEVKCPKPFLEPFMKAYFQITKTLFFRNKDLG